MAEWREELAVLKALVQYMLERVILLQARLNEESSSKDA
jgi:hypothetical protein